MTPPQTHKLRNEAVFAAAFEPPRATANAETWADSDAQQEDAGTTPLTAQEAQALRQNQPSISPVGVVVWQAVAGVLVALLAGLWFRSWPVLWSAAYGAAVVVVPNALMAWGLRDRGLQVGPGAAAANWMVWEMVKLLLAICLLALAAGLVQNLNWLALVAAMVVTMKVMWLAAWQQSQTPKRHR